MVLEAGVAALVEVVAVTAMAVEKVAVVMEAAVRELVMLAGVKRVVEAQGGRWAELVPAASLVCVRL